MNGSRWLLAAIATFGLSAVGSLAGCGPADRDPGSGGPDGGGPGGDGGGTGDGNPSSEGCSDEAKLVYVVDQNNQLSTFSPATKMFTDLGPLSCPAQFLATPFSMGVDREAIAWVLYSSGELFRVDTKTLQCTKSAWMGSAGLAQFGMGFSTDTVGGNVDTLFIAGGPTGPVGSTAALATLSTTTFQSTPVGTVTGSPELTGTGNAELWGFFPDPTSPRIAKLDKANGSALTTFPLPAIAGAPNSWAFAFWGGDFWIFLAKGSETRTTVYQVDGTTGVIETSTPTTSRLIVGAGVSTCAPVIL